ncbi:MAG: class I SAM-dependent methyltransferase [Mariniblastus sp.]|nr:class I SAM-dependent methyltransferase [Mariniblastus sp.]MDG2182955.1 class I SAM-dependent methyltransferase [Mariniblastus sp.]
MSRKTRSLSVKSIFCLLSVSAICLLLVSNTTEAEEPTNGPLVTTPSTPATAINNSGKNAQDDRKAKVPKGVDVYMGRRVAQTMHYLGAEWLIRNEREREERCSLMLANLGIRKGMTICDMGCGNGFHSLAMAKMTGKNGLVLGVDVQPEMLGFLRERMESEGLENVVPILGSFHNPHLPPNTVDLVLMVDVYHEFSHPKEMLASIRKSLKPDGLVVLVEYREEDPKVPIKPLHKMSKRQVNKELNANGFTLVKEFDKLPWQHMMFFGKSDLPLND